jgi:hypothetical protein
MMEKVNTLTLPEKLIAGGGILMLIASLFDWWTYSGFGESGWGEPGQIWSILAILISIGLAGIVIATKLGNMAMPNLPAGWTWGKVWGGAAAAIVVLMLLKLWRIMDVPVGSVGIGFILGAIAAGAIAYAGFLLYTSEKSP